MLVTTNASRPYREHFSPVLGRPSIPIETYLRMMLLKHRYGLGYETLRGEVADSLSWSRFADPAGHPVSHPSTLASRERLGGRFFCALLPLRSVPENRDGTRPGHQADRRSTRGIGVSMTPTLVPPAG